MATLSIYISLSVECPHCQHFIPINGATDSALCGNCSKVLPLPVSTWRSLIGDEIVEAAQLEEGTANTSTSFGELNSRLEIGRLAARCAECKTPYPAVDPGQLTGTITCAQCGAVAGARTAPDWLRQLHPSISYLLGESLTTGSASAMVETEPIVIHCVSCGGKLTIDGTTTRQLHCSYCQAENFLPDPIWRRLHPEVSRKPWFLELDLGNSLGVLPEDCSEFLGIGCGPAGQLLLGYSDDDERTWVVGLDQAGLIGWRSEPIAIESPSYARLCSGPGGHALVLLDCDAHRVHYLDPASGQVIGGFGAAGEPDRDQRPDPHQPRPLELDYYRDAVLDFDYTLIVVQYGDDETRPLLSRYAADGSWVPMWSAQPSKSMLKKLLSDPWRMPEWDQLGDHMLVLPDDSRIALGQNGYLYVVDERLRHLAIYERTGRLVENRQLTPPELESDLDALGVDAGGTLYALAELDGGGHDRWHHVLRVAPGGQPEVIAGPAVAGSAPIGEDDDRCYVTPNGTLYLAEGLTSIRLVDGQGKLLWRTLATERHDAEALE